MNNVLWATGAGSNLAESWGSRFRGSHAQLDSDDILMVLLIVAGAALAIWLLSRVPAVQNRVRRFNNPRQLFKQLCRAHELDRPSRRLLRRLARHHGMKQPALLFLEPERFRGRLDGKLVSERGNIQALRNRLFAGAQETPSGAAPASSPPSATDRPSG